MRVSVFAVLALVLAAASAQFVQPQELRVRVPILDYQHTRDDSGQYSLRYATGDGAAHSDRGFLKPSPEGYVLAREGAHVYTSPEGRQIKLSYIADENGYQPRGDHLPVAPAPLV